MKTALAILSLCVLTGCSTTVPVTVKFPAAPQELLTECEPNLITLDPKVSLSELTKVVVQNYSEYHVCAEKANLWIEWYNTQKSIYGTFK